MTYIKDLKINLESKILNSNKVILVPHKDIDFDAIGSAIGLSVISNKLKKTSFVVIDDPDYKIDCGVKLILNEAKNNFNFISRENYLDIANEEDLFILTDVNKSDLISLQDDIKNKENTFIVDHHAKGDLTLDSEYTFIDENSSSACEIVARLLNLFKFKYSPEIANYLLAGIYLDTNKLRNNISSETMRVVAKLLDNGANIKKVTDLFVVDFNSDIRVKELVGKAQIFTSSIALILADEQKEYTKEEIAKAADYLLRYNVDASFAIGNIGDHTLSISARSKENINVGLIMKELNGGGNQYSGATKLSNCTIEEAGKKLLKAINSPFCLK